MKNFIKKIKVPIGGISVSYVLSKYIESKRRELEMGKVDNKLLVVKPEILNNNSSGLFNNRSNDLSNRIQTYNNDRNDNLSEVLNSQTRDNNQTLINNINDINHLNFNIYDVNTLDLSVNEGYILIRIMRELHNLTVDQDNFNRNYDLLLALKISHIDASIYEAFKNNAREYLLAVRHLLDEDYFYIMINSIRLVIEDSTFMIENYPVPNEIIEWLDKNPQVNVNENIEASSNEVSNLVKVNENVEASLNDVLNNTNSLSIITRSVEDETFSLISSNVVSGSQNSENDHNNNNNNIDSSVINDEVDSSTLSESFVNINLQDLDQITRSDLSSLIYEVYNIIINLDYNTINNYIDSLNLPFIKFVGIIVLLCTILIFLCWVNIISYFISGSLLEYYKIKDKYPKIYKIISISRKFSYYNLILELILMIILYIIILFVCIDILLM